MLMVYGKKRTEKRFQAFDMNSNCFAGNKIYATIFQDNQREQLENEIRFMNDMNKDYIFEIRAVK